jgi:hypothetical protein
MSKLGPFEVGQIKAHLHHGLTGAAIVGILRKPDGKSLWSNTTIYSAIDKLLEDPAWRGEREEGSGAERKTDKQQDKALERYVLKNRGKEKVTVAVLRREFLWTRSVGNSLLEERLHEAGLKWLRRRRKTIVAEKYLRERIDYCNAVILKWQSTLDLWAYTDGTTFFLDRTLEENEETQMAAIGKWVWRYTDGRDALFQENLGPSAYKKAQGIPVRVWGMLSEGTLHIHILDPGEAMNNELYTELVEDKFENWLGGCRYLVQDFERCLRSPGPMHAFEKFGIELVEGYPRCSQDFNAIENCWALLRDRLYATLPLGLEPRESFVDRLNTAVTWLNRNKRSSLWEFARNQKTRCRECLATKPPGGRTKW